VTYEDCQIGAQAGALEWHQGYDRGMAAQHPGADDVARELGMEPVASLRGSFKIQSETVLHAGHREWLRLMQAGARRDS